MLKIRNNDVEDMKLWFYMIELGDKKNDVEDKKLWCWR